LDVTLPAGRQRSVEGVAHSIHTFYTGYTISPTTRAKL
jgi:hypothetical protein